MVDIKADDNGWTLTTEGGTMRLEDLKDGRVIAGDWECDGSDPLAALRLYRAAESFVDSHGFTPLITIAPDDHKLARFYHDMGWKVVQLVLQRDSDAWEKSNLSKQ